MSVDKAVYGLITWSAKNERGIRVTVGAIATLSGLAFAFVLYQCGILASQLTTATGDNQKVLTDVLRSSGWFAGFMGLIQVISTVALTYLPRSEAETAKIILDYDRRKKSSDKLMAWQTQLIDSTSNSLAALSAILERPADAQGFSYADDLNALLYPFFLEPEPRRRIFRYVGDAFFNVTVYAFNDEKGELVSIWRHKHKKFDELGKGMGRNWRPGVGHVGECYEKREIIVASDLQAASELSEVDKQLYASAVSIPIFTTTDSVCGVCVITSSKPNQFHDKGTGNGNKAWEELATPFESIGHILSVYMAYSLKGAQ